MTISNALPIQFWLTGEESFNNKQIDGITQICWCQPWHCADVLPLQFQSDDEEDYFLNIVRDSTDEVLDTLPFAKTQLYESDFISGYPLSGFTNESVGATAWTLGANPEVTLGPSGTSDRLVESVTGIPAGRYLFNFAYNYSGAGLILTTVTFLKGGVSVGTKSFGVDAEGEVVAGLIVLTDEPDTIRIRVTSFIASTRTITLYSIGMVTSGYYHAIDFDPSEYCNEQIRLQITDSASPGDALAESDCISIKTNHIATLAIDYQNSKNFNNLVYPNDSPEVSFRLRIPAIFFEEDNPAEQEDTELSNGEIVRLYNKIEKRKRLDVGFMPPYMHEKLQLVLMHDSITIDGREWIRRDAYEKQEGNRRYPLKRASVYLHDKNFIRENQL